DNYPESREGKRGPKCYAECCSAGAHATVKQDHRQRKVADQVRERVILEDNSARTIAASEHTDQEKDNENWNTNPGGKRAEQDTGGDQYCTNEKQMIYRASVQIRPF